VKKANTKKKKDKQKITDFYKLSVIINYTKMECNFKKFYSSKSKTIMDIPSEIGLKFGK